MDRYNQINVLTSNTSGNEQIENITKKMLSTASCPQCYVDNINILNNIIDLVEMPEEAEEQYKLLVNNKIDYNLDIDLTTEVSMEYPHIDMRELHLLMSSIALISSVPNGGVLPTDLSSDIIDVCVHDEKHNHSIL